MNNIERIEIEGGYGLTYKVIGDSMEPGFMEGDIILLDRTMRAERNDLVIAITGHPPRPVFGRLAIERSQRFLKFTNPRYPAIEIAGNELFGVVIEFTDPPGLDKEYPDAAA